MDDVSEAGIEILAIFALIIGFAMLLGLCLLLKALFLWNWKVNTRIDKQTKTINIQNNILEELQKKNSH